MCYTENFVLPAYTSMALSVNRGMCSRLCLLQLTIPWGLANRQTCPFVTAAVAAITTNTSMFKAKKTTQRLGMELSFDFIEENKR